MIFKLRSFDNLWNFCVNAHVVAFKINLIVCLETIYRIFFLSGHHYNNITMQGKAKSPFLGKLDTSVCFPNQVTLLVISNSTLLNFNNFLKIHTYLKVKIQPWQLEIQIQTVLFIFAVSSLHYYIQKLFSVSWQTGNVLTERKIETWIPIETQGWRR